MTRPRRILALVAVATIATGCFGGASSPTSPSPSATAAPTGGGTVSSPPTATPSQSYGSSAALGAWVTAGAIPLEAGIRLVPMKGGAFALTSGWTDEPNRAAFWDATTSTWREVTGLNKGRSAFALAPLTDGRVLVAGGENDVRAAYSSAYAFDPTSAAWTKVGLLGTARFEPAAAVLRDGRVLVAGGRYSAGEAERLLMAAPTRTAGVVPGTPTRFADVDVPPYGIALATAELFDPTTGTWSATGNLRRAVSGAVATTLADGRVLVVGASSCEIYDPATGRFATVGSVPTFDRAALARLLPGAVLGPYAGDRPDLLFSIGALVPLDDGGAVLIGHAEEWKHEADVTRSFRFDPRSEKWTEIGRTFVSGWDSGREHELSLPGVPNLDGAAVATLPGNRLLIAGGNGVVVATDNGHLRPTAAVLVYDASTDTWSDGPAMPEARTGAVAVTLSDGSILVVGGSHDDASGDWVDVREATRFVPSIEPPRPEPTPTPVPTPVPTPTPDSVTGWPTIGRGALTMTGRFPSPDYQTSRGRLRLRVAIDGLRPNAQIKFVAAARWRILWVCGVEPEPCGDAGCAFLMWRWSTGTSRANARVHATDDGSAVATMTLAAVPPEPSCPADRTARWGTFGETWSRIRVSAPGLFLTLTPPRLEWQDTV